ncbi:hypothetical protein SKAU_G00072850 [Synaphobranchus kaupii]|uniref:Uncharacterized protein n=1 Tax=Synaphobranchus kaupii TaxID=118154 RepID=A0A9Q1G796_SYNKA|nr:hypothetical protein SKAU_G00072850 [Synaphobranchus kaupii]
MEATGRLALCPGWAGGQSTSAGGSILGYGGAVAGADPPSEPHRTWQEGLIAAVTSGKVVNWVPGFGKHAVTEKGWAGRGAVERVTRT